MKRYRVTYEAVAEVEVQVQANSEREAEEAALKQLDPNVDWDLNKIEELPDEE